MQDLMLWASVVRRRWWIVLLATGLTALSTLVTTLMAPQGPWAASVVVWIEGTYKPILVGRLQSRQTARALPLAPAETITVQEDRLGLTVVAVRSADETRVVSLANAVVGHVQERFEADRQEHQARLETYRHRQIAQVRDTLRALREPLPSDGAPALRDAPGPVVIVGVPTPASLLAQKRADLTRRLEELSLGPPPTSDRPALVVIDPAWQAIPPVAASIPRRLGWALGLGLMVGVVSALTWEWWTRARAAWLNSLTNDR